MKSGCDVWNARNGSMKTATQEIFYSLLEIIIVQAIATNFSYKNANFYKMVTVFVILLGICFLYSLSFSMYYYYAFLFYSKKNNLISVLYHLKYSWKICPCTFLIDWRTCNAYGAHFQHNMISYNIIFCEILCLVFLNNYANL